ncbi:MAG: WYL domain-containing protein [Bacilli bacterium]|nr:WYL domain-containing protein [Bacilli bacterium]
MGFWFDDISTEWKQHINLSESAWIIILDDIKNFYSTEKEESFSGFLNRIFRNFYQMANATISLRLKEREEELLKLYSSKEFENVNSDVISTIVYKHLDVYENSLIEAAKSYKSGHGEKFRINKENLDLLRESQEDEYYEGNAGKYLKAIFEEYAEKPTYVREQIFFYEIIDKIQTAIANQRKLKITLNDKITVKEDKTYNRKFYVSPYKIEQDFTKTYNYLIGYSSEIDRDDETEKPCCFRISRINKINIQNSMGAKISKEKGKELDNLLLERTVMFMSSDPIDIVIKFTDKGLESFRRQLYMRPRIYTIDKNDKHVYTFRCSEIQAINYFFKFGWDANVISPIELHEKIKLRYQRSFMTYDGVSKEEIINGEK